MALFITNTRGGTKTKTTPNREDHLSWVRPRIGQQKDELSYLSKASEELLKSLAPLRSGGGVGGTSLSKRLLVDTGLFLLDKKRYIWLVASWPRPPPLPACHLSVRWSNEKNCQSITSCFKLVSLWMMSRWVSVRSAHVKTKNYHAWSFVFSASTEFHTRWCQIFAHAKRRKDFKNSLAEKMSKCYGSFGRRVNRYLWNIADVIFIESSKHVSLFGFTSIFFYWKFGTLRDANH